MDSTSELLSLHPRVLDVPVYSTCIYLDWNIITNTMRRPAEQVGLWGDTTNHRCIKVIFSVHPWKHMVGVEIEIQSFLTSELVTSDRLTPEK